MCPVLSLLPSTASKSEKAMPPHLGEKEKEKKGRFEAAQTSKSTICGDIFVHVKSKFKPVKDNRVLYFSSILRPQWFLHEHMMKWLLYQMVVELCIQYCVLEYA